MTVSCPECSSVFRVDPAKVPASGVRARCSVCGGVITISAASIAAAVGTAPSLTPASAGAKSVTKSVAGAIPSAASRSTAQVSAHATPTAPRTPTSSATPFSSGTPASGATQAEPARRHVNPFQQADPGQRARRLARALVSDLVAYHPQKLEQGARDGTIRQLFREEIKKSYEEYVDQVGSELADRTPHFQDALNDILGGGKKLF